MRPSPLLVAVSLAVSVGCGASSAVVARPVAPLVVTDEQATLAAQQLAQHVDAHLGLVEVFDVTDAEGETPAVRRATLRCGDEVTTLSTELAAYLASRPPVGEAPGWSCDGADCELPGMMEYDANRILRFARTDDDRVVVRGLFQIDALAVDAEHLARTRQNADRDYDELSHRPCE